jgi:hypothetical protein
VIGKCLNNSAGNSNIQIVWLTTTDNIPDESIFTEADDLETLKIAVKDAINCHFDTSEQRPKIISYVQDLYPLSQ